MKQALAPNDATEIEQFVAELSVLHLDKISILDKFISRFRRLLETDTLLLLSPTRTVDGLGIERYHGDNLPGGSRFKASLTRFLTNAPRRFAWYDAIRPEPAQRNRVIDPSSIIPSGEFEASAVYRDLLAPNGVAHHRQLRVLICDGPDFLGWFGTFHDGHFQPRHARLFRAIIPALRRRLIVERQLQTSTRAALALEAALEQFGAPAFVVNGRGLLVHINQAGDAVLATRGEEVRRGLRDAIAGRTSTIPLTIMSLAERASPPLWLATLRMQSEEDQVSQCVSAAAVRWGLTPRQHAVLQSIVQGQANGTIAALSGTSERAVEQHVTALFDRAGVDSRSALVARVLLPQQRSG